MHAVNAGSLQRQTVVCCLEFPYCKVCKRHLSSHCLDETNICHVRFHFHFLLSNIPLEYNAMWVLYLASSICFRLVRTNERHHALLVP